MRDKLLALANQMAARAMGQKRFVMTEAALAVASLCGQIDEWADEIRALTSEPSQGGEVVCAACGGSGKEEVCRTVPKCCGRTRPNGDCCGNPDPDQQIDYDTCSNCGGSGVNAAPPPAEPSEVGYRLLRVGERIEIGDQLYSDAQRWRPADLYAGTVVDSHTVPIRRLAQPQRQCGCGLSTCVEPWEPGCGLGTSVEHAVPVEPQRQGQAGTVADYSDGNLVERAVRNCYINRSSSPRWAHISDAFALGSTYSKQLCARFGLDPDELKGYDPNDEQPARAAVVDGWKLVPTNLATSPEMRDVLESRYGEAETTQQLWDWLLAAAPDRAKGGA